MRAAIVLLRGRARGGAGGSGGGWHRVRSLCPDRWSGRLLASLVGAALLMPAPAAAAGAHPAGGVRLPGFAGQTTSMMLAADQASEQVLLIDPAGDTEDSDGVEWSWEPWDDPEAGDLDPDTSWRNVSEAKPYDDGESSGVLVASSEGLAAVVEYPSGWVRWGTVIPNANLHSIELLPDGNVAIAASSAGFVRVYAAQGARDGSYVQAELAGAHGVQWDGDHDLLWVLGDTELVGYSLGGSADSPDLTEELRVELPTYGGHDLSPVAGGHDRLWVTTSSGVYQFSTSDEDFVPYANQDQISRGQVKSVGDDPVTGQVLTVTPDPENPCSWCTSTVRFHNPDGSFTLADSSLYKVRWWQPPAN